MCSQGLDLGAAERLANIRDLILYAQSLPQPPAPALHTATAVLVDVRRREKIYLPATRIILEALVEELARIFSATCFMLAKHFFLPKLPKTNRKTLT